MNRVECTDDGEMTDFCCCAAPLTFYRQGGPGGGGMGGMGGGGRRTRARPGFGGRGFQVRARVCVRVCGFGRILIQSMDDLTSIPSQLPHPQGPGQPPQQKPREITLVCTLEELYKGATKHPTVKATVPTDPWGMGTATRCVFVCG